MNSIPIKNMLGLSAITQLLIIIFLPMMIFGEVGLYYITTEIYETGEYELGANSTMEKTYTIYDVEKRGSILTKLLLLIISIPLIILVLLKFKGCW